MLHTTLKGIIGHATASAPDSSLFLLALSMKEGYYFPHFSNARNDRKVKRLRKELGVEGYGLFMMTLEVLRDQPELCYPISDIDLLADDFGTSVAKLEAVVRAYDLFQITPDNFFSPRLIDYMEPYMKQREQRSIAGKASAEARKQRLLQASSTVVERSLNGRNTVVQQREENKQEEKKPKQMKSAGYSPDFESAWIAYGCKGAKKDAYKVWQTLSQDEREKAVDAIPHYFATVTEIKFRKDFERYLKSGKFEATFTPQSNGHAPQAGTPNYHKPLT